MVLHSIDAVLHEFPSYMTLLFIWALFWGGLILGIELRALHLLGRYTTIEAFCLFFLCWLFLIGSCFIFVLVCTEILGTTCAGMTMSDYWLRWGSHEHYCPGWL
jgi:hypothetical protein